MYIPWYGTVSSLSNKSYLVYYVNTVNDDIIHVVSCCSVNRMKSWEREGETGTISARRESRLRSSLSGACCSGICCAARQKTDINRGGRGGRRRRGRRGTMCKHPLTAGCSTDWLITDWRLKGKKKIEEEEEWLNDPNRDQEVPVWGSVTIITTMDIIIITDITGIDPLRPHRTDPHAPILIPVLTSVKSLLGNWSLSSSVTWVSVA